MQYLMFLIDFILHIDQHLAEMVRDYGTLTYAILFVIVFCETGLVVTPLLPGDSLLFAAGTLTVLGDGALNPWLLVLLLTVAAILGDGANYMIARFFGKKWLETGKLKFIKPSYLQKTEAFYEKYGGKAIVLARFVPIVRTFAPFVAGIGKMNYAQFSMYNVVGAVAWVNIFVWAGHFFADQPLVRKNFTLVIFGIIGISVLPMVYEIAKAWLESRKKQA